jgi:putative ABC transport system substrate-binding protein
MNTRREFITLLGGAAAAWPLTARGQQGERTRRVGVLMSTAAGDAEGRARIAAFLLEKLGWIEGRTARIDTRWPTSMQEVRKYSDELVGLAPDVLLATGSVGLSGLVETTRTVPIVFVNVGDPVGGGFVESLARPGGNATGFSFSEYSNSVKWLELLKEITPGLARVAVLRDAKQASGSGQFGAIQTVAPSLGVELTPIDVRDASEIERAVAAFARRAKAGLIITTGQMTLVHRDLIINLAARHALPTVYWNRFYPAAGGLISYGPDPVDPYRRAAGYVDRILKGEAAGAPARAVTGSRACGGARQSRECCQYGGHVERRASRCPHHGAANPGHQRQHQPRDRCSLRHFRARAA